MLSSGKVVTRKKKASRGFDEDLDRLLSQVERDLEPWKESGISIDMVEKAYCTKHISASVRIQVDLSYVTCDQGARSLALHFLL